MLFVRHLLQTKIGYETNKISHMCAYKYTHINFYCIISKASLVFVQVGHKLYINFINIVLVLALQIPFEF